MWHWTLGRIMFRSHLRDACANWRNLSGSEHLAWWLCVYIYIDLPPHSLWRVQLLTSISSVKVGKYFSLKRSTSAAFFPLSLSLTRYWGALFIAPHNEITAWCSEYLFSFRLSSVSPLLYQYITNLTKCVITQ